VIVEQFIYKATFLSSASELSLRTIPFSFSIFKVCNTVTRVGLSNGPNISGYPCMTHEENIALYAVIKGLLGETDHQIWYATLEPFLPEPNTHIDQLEDSTCQLYELFCSDVVSSNEDVSATLLWFLCERILLTANLWESWYGLITHRPPVLEIVWRLSEQESQRINNRLSEYYFGICSIACSDYHKALEHFERSSKLVEKRHYLLRKNMIASLYLKPYQNRDRTASGEHFSAFCPKWREGDRERVPEGSGAIALFFDDLYFSCFAENFVDSVCRHKSKEALFLHFHITNCRSESREHLDVLTDRAARADVVITASFDEYNVTSRTYYTCTRFLALPLLLNVYKGVLTLDADLEMAGNPVELLNFFHEKEDIDFAVLPSSAPWQQGVRPWRSIAAGYSYFASKPAVFHFARNFRFFLQYWWIDGFHCWWIDQACFFFALHEVRMTTSTLHVRTLFTLERSLS
jgi:hypothetical protein